MDKKGQAALEFLMTYGWAILVVLVVIAALAYFGVLSPQSILPSKCTLETGLSCDAYVVKDDGSGSIKITNGKGKQLTFVSATMEEVSAGVAACDGTSSTPEIDNGNSATKSFPTTCGFKSTGAKDKFVLAISYWFTDEGVEYTHTITGELTTRVEAVAAP